MSKINIKGLNFVPLITKEEIAKQVNRVAEEIRKDCGDKDPLFVCVLNGAFMFAADLVRACNFINSEISFIRYKSYSGMASTGKIKTVLGLEEDITNRNVIIIEDIVDTGVTAKNLIANLQEKNPASIKLATLLFKPDSLSCDIKPDYVGFNIPSKFILGYGLDLDGLARNLSDIYVLDEEQK